MMATIIETTIYIFLFAFTIVCAVGGLVNLIKEIFD